MPIIISTHPRTRSQMVKFDLALKNTELRFEDPFGFFEFITLERNARCVLSDSGTVQEECAIFGVPHVTMRDVTERPETIECGSNMLSGAEPGMIADCVRAVLDQECKWKPPREYHLENVSDTVTKILLGYLHKPEVARL